jgi:hypothetical protein
MEAIKVLAKILTNILAALEDVSNNRKRMV